MSKFDERQLRQDITDEILTQKFKSELGSQARVERTALQNERLDQLREVLSDIGKDLSESGAVPRGMQYCGSLSVHIYKSEVLKTAAFATLSSSENLTFDLADAGLRELTGTTHESYGKKRQKTRSGF